MMADKCTPLRMYAIMHSRSPGVDSPCNIGNMVIE